jgi:hypothetical protein
MGKTFKKVTVEDLENMGIDIKAILQEKTKKKKKRRKNKNKPLKKVDDKSFSPKPPNLNGNTGLGGSGGPPIIAAKTEAQLNAEEKLSAKIKENDDKTTNRIDNFSDKTNARYNDLNDRFTNLGNYLYKNQEDIKRMYHNNKNFYKTKYVTPNKSSSFGNPVIDNVYTRFDVIENKYTNNLTNAQSTNFERDEIPEPDYFNPSDNVGGVNEKEVEFESNYEDEAMKRDELANDYQQPIKEEFIEPEYDEDDEDDEDDFDENGAALDSSQNDAEIARRKQVIADTERVREYANGKGGRGLTDSQRIILDEMLQENLFEPKQVERVNKYKEAYLEEDDEDVKIVKHKQPTRASSRIKEAVKNNKDPEEFKSPKKSKK